MDIWLRNQNTIYKEKYQQVLKVKDSVEVLILGNSHANYGVDPDSFSLYAFNLANVNQSLYFDKRVTLSILDKLSKLKYVFISIDYHSLYFSDQGLRNIWAYYGNGVKYKDEGYFLADLSPFLFGYTPKFAVSMLKKSIYNKIIYGKDMKIDFDVENGIDVSKAMKKGFICFDNVNENIFNDSFYEARARAFNNVVHDSAETDEIIADLEDFIRILKDHNIIPVLYTTPTFREYNRYLDQWIVDNNRMNIQKLCLKYNVQHLDYMNSKHFEKFDFNSCDHLNQEGARKFGKILNDLLMVKIF